MLSPHLIKVWEDLCARIDPDELALILSLLVNTASPTGEEGEVARVVVDRLRAQGLQAEEQVIDDLQSNAVARLKGSGTAPSLMLYSPLDTVTSNDASEDLPWAGQTMESELLARAVVSDGHVSGLGAQNPKGHAACAIAAFELLAKADLQLEGDVILGLGCGGMPSNPRPNTGQQAGHGNGCAWMLEHGWRPDFAIIAKSGWSVSWEEVGFNWYEVSVFGAHTYVGSRHLIPYTNAIENAGKVIRRLEDWFPKWAIAEKSGLVEPQGVVSWIESGWSRMPAFTPAECRFRFDLRLSPRTSAEEADKVIENLLADIAQEEGVELRWRRIVSIPGTSTPKESLVVRSAIEAWEAVARTTHAPNERMSGATDANILRAFGVPTARIGLPKAERAGGDFQRGMNMVRIQDMVELTRVLLFSALDICAQPDQKGGAE